MDQGLFRQKGKMSAIDQFTVRIERQPNNQLHTTQHKADPNTHRLSLATLLEDVSQTAATAVLTVVVHGHEDTSTASLVGALTTETGDLSVVVDLVVLEDRQLDLLPLVLDLLGGGVGLLLALLTTTTETEDEVEGGLLLDVVVYVEKWR